MVPIISTAAVTPLTRPAIAPPERDGSDELEAEDDACAVGKLVADNVGDVGIEEEAIEPVVGIDGIEAEAEATSSFVKISMLW